MLHVSTHIKIITRQRFKNIYKRKLPVNNGLIIKLEIIDISALHSSISYIDLLRNSVVYVFLCGTLRIVMRKICCRLGI